MSKRVPPKIGTVVKIEMSGNRYNAIDSKGNKLTSYIRAGTRKGAYMKGMALECREGAGGRIYWWKVPMEKFGTISHVPEAPIHNAPRANGAVTFPMAPGIHAQVNMRVSWCGV